MFKTRVYGSGSKTIIAFNGFNPEGTDFSFLHPGTEFKVIEIVPDLDFSENPEIFLNEIFLLQKKETKQKVILIGYSLGCHVVLKYLEHFSESIESVILMAPLLGKRARYFKILSGNKLGLAILKFSARFPVFPFTVLKSISKVRKNRKSHFQSIRHLQSKESFLKDIYRTWKWFGNFKVSMPKVRNIINGQEIRTLFIVGETDPITPLQPVLQLTKEIRNSKIAILDKGHWLSGNDTRQAVLDFLF